MKTRLIVISLLFGSARLAGAASYSVEPYWGTTFDTGGDYTLPSCVLLGSTTMGPDAPLVLSFRGGRGGIEMFLGGRFHAEPGPVPVTITVDDDPQRWTFKGLAELNGTTVPMTDDAATRDLFARLATAKTIHLDAAGDSYSLSLGRWPVAYPEWSSC